MSPNTKSKVKYSRQVQLFLRVLALFGALGLLFCVIAIKGTSGSLGWIIRVAPSVALLHTMYAVYHLCRSVTGRTAASSSGYMLFAAMIDAGLLPFLAFSAYMSYNEHTSAMYGWDTLFGVPLTTWYIVYSTFLLCVIEGALLLISLILGMYLAILFRKIAKLPPDMNPLEPNLTARPHKRNKSEFTVSDKHMSQTSLVSNNRMSSTADPLITPGRRVPFMHTRTDSADRVPMYQNNSARSSRMDASRPDSLYQQSNHSFRGSYSPINKSLPTPPSRPQSAMAPSINSRQPGNGLDHRPARSSLLAPDDNAWQTAPQNARVVSPLETYHQQATISPRHFQTPIFNDENIATVSPVSSRASTPDPDRDAEYMEIKNWYESPRMKNKKSQDYAPIHQQQPQQQQYPPTRAQQARHERRESLYDFDCDLRSPSPITNPKFNKTEGPRNPLGMNPPSPEFSEHETEKQMTQQQNTTDQGTDEPKRYALYDAPVNLPPPSQRPKGSSRPSSFIGSGSKGRYYGDLRSPVGSVNMAAPTDTASNYSDENLRTQTMDSGISGIGSLSIRGSDDENFVVLARDNEDDENEARRDGQHPRVETSSLVNGASYGDAYDALESDRKGRVVSNTGHDLSSGYAGLGAEFGRGMGRRRDVSGKIAEEGRGIGTMGYVAPAPLAPSGLRQGGGALAAKANGASAGAGAGAGAGGAGGGGRGAGIAAAGWARFKGL
jgi:hypothetical protein